MKSIHDHVVKGIVQAMPTTIPLAEAQVTAELIWQSVLQRLFPEPPDDSGEWHRFGTHVACRGVKLEFSGETDAEDGLPLWERIVMPRPEEIIEQWTEVTSPPCSICGTPVQLGGRCPVCSVTPRGFGGLPATATDPR